MNPFAAVGRCLGACFFEFSGRAGRVECCSFLIFAAIVNGLVDSVFPFASLGASVCLLVLFAFLPPVTAVVARRLHDLGLSGWLQLPAWLAIALAVAVMVTSSQVLGLVLLVLLAGGGLVFLARPGQDGANRFGEPVIA